jgi:hypothetical protein
MFKDIPAEFVGNIYIMKKNMRKKRDKINLPWEKSINGFFAKGYIPIKNDIFHPNMSAAKHIAELKMTQIKAISAEFKGTYAFFEPSISLLLEFNRRVHFYGLYEKYEGYVEDDDPEIVPLYCFRKSIWSHDNQYKDLPKAESKREYLLSNKHIKSIIYFGNLKSHPHIVQLSSEIREMAFKGFVFKKVKGNHPYKSTRLSIPNYFNGLSNDIFYCQHVLECKILDDWIDKWQKSFEEIDKIKGLIPDKGTIEISYNQSMWEKIYEFT